MALPVKSEFDIALTYYYFEGKEQYIRKEDITAVAFEEVSNVKIKDFKVEDVECADDTYEAYTIIVTVQALEMGVNHAENVTIYAHNGAQYICPFGSWYFDVDEEDAGYVDAYSAFFPPHRLINLTLITMLRKDIPFQSYNIGMIKS